MSTESSIFDPELTLLRLKRPDFLIVYGALIILTILYIVVVILGQETAYFQSLKQDDIPSWVISGVWLFGTVMSYVAFFFIWQDVRVHPVPQDLIVSTLYIITDFLFLAWALAFYYGNDINASITVAIAIFVYNLWLFVYVYRISPIASIFLIPNLILYVYLIYSGIHLASINHV